MNNKDEALKMAIEYFEFEQKVWAGLNKENYYDKPINACKEALEQPAQEPLSNEEVTKLWAKFEIELVGCDVRDWTRVIEQAHGIGVK